TDRSAQNEWFGDVGHFNRGLQPGHDTDLLQSTLERHSVDNRREHTHVISRRAIHSTMAGCKPPPDVATPNNDRNLHSQIPDLEDLLCDIGHDPWRDRLEASRFTKRFAAQL